ncbi:hypothetical protein LCGC14_0693840 [marine sediment metagenome]|uniref:Uncharacterized protein n=1 Tax=marine sediment metagenome TaxID=412755 RepID=A0A0F9TSP5_9ZZZZ
MDEDVREELVKFTFRQGLAVGVCAGIFAITAVHLVLELFFMCVRYVEAGLCG